MGRRDRSRSRRNKNRRRERRREMRWRMSKTGSRRRICQAYMGCASKEDVVIVSIHTR